MKWEEIGDTECATASALSVIGDRWTLLILRELSMDSRRFEYIQVQTGMSSNLLSSRLRRLERDGIIERRQYQSSPARFEYFTTNKGKDLDPVLVLLRSCGLKWRKERSNEEPSVRLWDRETGDEIGPVFSVGGNAKPFRFDDVTTQVSEAFASERADRKRSFDEAKARKRIKTQR